MIQVKRSKLVTVGPKCVATTLILIMILLVVLQFLAANALQPFTRESIQVDSKDETVGSESNMATNDKSQASARANADKIVIGATRRFLISELLEKLNREQGGELADKASGSYGWSRTKDKNGQETDQDDQEGEEHGKEPSRMMTTRSKRQVTRNNMNQLYLASDFKGE